MNTLQSIQKKKKSFAQVVSDTSSKKKMSSEIIILKHTLTLKKRSSHYIKSITNSNTRTSTIQNTQKQNRTSKSAKEYKEQKLNLQHNNQSTLIHTNNFSLSSSNDSLDHSSYSLSPILSLNTISLLENTSLSNNSTGNVANKKLNMRINDNIDDCQMDTQP